MTAFTTIARALQGEARELGLQAPAFRTTKRGGQRALRRYPNVVLVVVPRASDPKEIARDMIDGIIRANGLTALEEPVVRFALWEAFNESQGVLL